MSDTYPALDFTVIGEHGVVSRHETWNSAFTYARWLTTQTADTIVLFDADDSHRLTWKDGKVRIVRPKVAQA